MDEKKLPARVAYIFDEKKRMECNSEGFNFWDGYYEEIMDELGITADYISNEKELGETLHSRDVILCGDMHITKEIEKALFDWVRDGGILLGFRTRGLDELFGIDVMEDLPQADDEYTINGYIELKEERKNYLPLKDLSNVFLPVISPVLKIMAEDAEVIASMHEPVLYVCEPICPAIIRREIGNGQVFFYNFSLSQTQYVLHQGRPVDRDWDGDGYYRTADGIVMTIAHDLSIPYADYHNLILQHIIDKKFVPSIYPLPPKEGQVTDLLLQYGGDDEGDTSGVQETASDWMKSRGLPYHINIMERENGKEGFAVSPEQYKKIKANGHECSIHFNFVKVRTHYTRKEFDRQLDLYEKWYGETPLATVNHYMMTTGWVDQPRWSCQRGIKGDNNRSNGRFVPVSNPINTFSMGFGTMYPHFVYEDYAHNNRKLPYVYIPGSYYEPRIRRECHEHDVNLLHSIMDKAAENAWTISCFYHPTYVVNDPECRAAIEEVLRYLDEKKHLAVHMGTDAICLWWNERSESAIFNFLASENKTSMIVKAVGKAGIILRLPNCTLYGRCRIDGLDTPVVRREVSGRSCQLVVIPEGEHYVELF